jgi:hypothetical protein
MEDSQNTLAWWWAHKATLASSILFLAAVLTIAFPVFAQRRLPKLDLAELTCLAPQLRWLRWGSPLVSWGSGLLVAAGVFYLLHLDKTSARLGDDQGVFLLAVILCIPSLSAGIVASGTGVYREIVGRGERAGKYYCVAGTRLRWVPWAHIVAALAVAALSLTGFFLTAPR